MPDGEIVYAALERQQDGTWAVMTEEYPHPVTDELSSGRRSRRAD